MTDKTGAARLRQAIKNQRDAGEGEFRLTYHDAEEIADEIEEELLGICSSAERETGRYAWAHGVPAPVDADGEVVPLTTKVMYTHMGKKIELSEFYLLHSVLSGGFVWRAIRDTGHSEDLKLGFLHLRRPDSWEKLEKDVSKAASEDICGYFGFALSRPCSAECPARDVRDSCAVTAVRDVMLRAKALAERDAKGPTPQPSPHGAKEANHG